jgi:hypothetical protein
MADSNAPEAQAGDEAKRFSEMITVTTIEKSVYE